MTFSERTMEAHAEKKSGKILGEKKPPFGGSW